MKKMISRLSLTIIGLLFLGTATANAQPAPNYSYIYGIGNDGVLKWYRHTGAATGAGLETPGAWLGANEVGTGWNGFESVFPGGLNTIYLIRADGRLEWRQHKGARDGLKQWEEGKTVGRGWNGFKQVFSVGGGIIYVIEPGGKLRWYKHNGYQTGAGMETPGAWEGPKEVGRGWADFKQVFPGGNGIIYAITQDGKLRWYKHNGYLSGAGMETSGAWEGPNEVGRGWADFQNVFSAGNGIIYAITQEGKLIWYKHNGYLTGAGMETPGAWENPKEIGRGWGGFVQVFALLPDSPRPQVDSQWSRLGDPSEKKQKGIPGFPSGPWIEDVRVIPGWQLSFSFKSSQSRYHPQLQLSQEPPIFRNGRYTFPVSAANLLFSLKGDRFAVEADALYAQFEFNKTYNYIITVFNDFPADTKRKIEQITDSFVMGSAANPPYVCDQARRFSLGADGSKYNCSPFKCETGRCLKTCKSVNDCVSPTVCDFSGQCIYLRND